MMKNAIITGSPFCGKSTLVKLLRNTYPNLEIKELDEMLIALNGGTWPDDEPLRNGILLPKVIDDILSKDGDFVFFTSYISPKNIEKAKEKGFIFIQLTCPREILVSRNIKHDESRQLEMDRNIEYQEEIRELNLPDKVISCAQEPTQIMEELLTILK